MSQKTLSTVEGRPVVRVAQVPRTRWVSQGVEAGGLTVALLLGPPHMLRLTWRRPRGGPSIQWVDLVPRPLPFGGRAWWFRCSCGCRASAVYLNDAGDTWGCRSCLRLVYRSQRTRYPAPAQGEE
ncbi:hypothetical protein [Holophaga foetida]|uniref:hypothetical protein n=1 Tax=Holophaga foetida TaxID=35839 RepID=UPI0002473B4C|nr:hypothetical protein [Holophaga foetida]